jgi:hypothetical protein
MWWPGTKLLFPKLSSESMTKGVNLTYSTVWAWESNQEPTQVWNRNPIHGVQKGLEPMTNVLWDKILVKKKNFIFLFFIPWWWVLSTMGLLLLLIVKLFIVYLGTISFVEVHYTGVWEVYSCTIYQRLAFENMFGGEVYFTRPRKKRNLTSSLFLY